MTGVTQPRGGVGGWLTRWAIPLGYTVGAAIWIFATDSVLNGLTDDVRTLALLQTGKGTLFVLLSAALLARLVHGENTAREALRRALGDEARRRRETQQTLETFLSSVPVGVLVLEGETVRFFNAATRKYLPEPERWKIGVSFRTLVPPEFADEVARLHQRVRVERVAIVAQHEVGGLLWETTHVPLLNAEGQLDAIALLGRDVTAERRAQDAMRGLALRTIALREEEQARISRDLHDDLGQQLTALKLQVRAVENGVAELPTAPPELIDRTVELSTLTDQVLIDLRRISQGLRPAALQALGLATALTEEARTFSRRTGLEVKFEIDEVEGLDDATSTTFFRVAQEALTNISRHAKATHVRVCLKQDALSTRLEVDDDGVGFPARPDSLALGLLGMRERAAQIGGTIAFGQTDGRGASVSLAVPRRRP